VSGYFGVVRFDGKPVERKLLEQIAEQLAFRGRDGVSIWSKQTCGGCFTRMDTHSAPQSLEQPVIFNQRYFLWGDIRIDAAAELRAQLADAGSARDTTETSEELLLRAWNHWSEQALQHVIGDFSFALWDAREQCLTCARDFIGPRPLYYSQAGSALYFGNTLNVFRSVPEISLELDEQFIADFLLEGMALDPERSIYRNIRRLPSGHLLKFSKNGLVVQRFLKLPVEDPLVFACDRDCCEDYLGLLRQAVSDRLPQGAVSLCLSGGLDSSSVAAIATDIAGANLQQHRVKAFTLGWAPFVQDPEPPFASLTAQHLGIPHQVLNEPELMLFAGAGSPEWQSPEPDQEYFFARAKKQSQHIAAHSNVALGGDGGDVILTGQSWPYLVYLWQRRDWKNLIHQFGGYLWTNRRFPPLRAGLRGRIGELLKATDKFAGYPRWLNAAFESRLKLRQRWEKLSGATTPPEHPLHPQAYESLHSGYWASVLETEDAGWTGVPLELRAPLLDLRLLRFLLRLPPVPWCVNKALTRRAMANKLPDAVVQRPKTPLVDDPLSHCELPAGWAADVSLDHRGRLEMFVNWDKWCETLSGPKGSLSWLSLRPVSLLYWLKAVENRMGIK